MLSLVLPEIRFDMKLRMKILLFIALSLVAQGISPCQAFSKTGYYALDNPAIAIKDPAQTPLVAITRIGRRLIAVGLHGVIVVSDDSGVSWRQASVPVDLTLTAVYCESAQNCWAVGHYGVILQSRDGGMTWARSVDGLDVIAAVKATAARDQAATPPDPGTALAQRVATAYQSAGPSKPFLTIGPCGSGILAIGQQDIAMYSADHGKSWNTWTSQITDPQFANIYDIINAGGSTFLIGEGGLVLKSAANCMNFAVVSGPFSATLFGGISNARGAIVVYGLEGGIFASGDNGNTWNTMSVSSGTVIDSGLLLNNGQMLLGSLGGNFWIGDADVTGFHQTSANVPFQISDMAVAPDGSIVIIGNGGVRLVPLSSLR